MKNSKGIPAQTVKNLMMHMLKRDANSTTCFAIYQPKAPGKLESLKKSKYV